MFYYCGLCAAVSAFCSDAICIWFRRSTRSGGIWRALVRSIARLVCSAVRFFRCAPAAGLVPAADLLPLSAACPALSVLAHGVQVCRCRAALPLSLFPGAGLRRSLYPAGQSSILYYYIFIYMAIHMNQTIICLMVYMIHVFI